jgi:disulfide bond formation protein DsbB
MEAILTPLVPPRRALALCLLGSAGLLAGAHAFERIGGMAPCLLCLDQREVHWAALGVALVLLLFARARAFAVVAAGLGALTMIYVFSAGLAGFHAGVEWGFWEGPSGCAAGGDVPLASSASVLASLDEAAAGPSCSEAAWRLLGISMAGYNMIASSLLAAVSALACLFFARRPVEERALSA